MIRCRLKYLSLNIYYFTMSTLAVQFHSNGYLAPFYLFMTARVLCNPFNFILGTMQPVISFWVLCNPFNLFGYYATRLICFLGYYATRYFDFGYYATRFKLFLPLGTMQPVQSIFGVPCNPLFHYRTLHSVLLCNMLLYRNPFISLVLGTTQPLISLSGTMTMQHCRVLCNLHY